MQGCYTPVFMINRKSLNCSSQHQKQEMEMLHSCIFDQQSLLITRLATTTCMYSHGSLKYICQTDTFLTLSSLLPDKNKFFTCCYSIVSNLVMTYAQEGNSSKTNFSPQPNLDKKRKSSLRNQRGSELLLFTQTVEHNINSNYELSRQHKSR